MNNKVCNKCGNTKNILDFYKHKNSKDGHANTCKICVKARAVEWNKNNKDKKKASSRKWARENAERVRELQKEYYQRNKDVIDARYAEWKKENPEKVKSYSRKWANANKDKIENYYAENKERLDECRKQWVIYNRESVNKSNSNWKKTNPKKVKAHSAVSNALRDGRLLKPLSCEFCGVFTDTLHAHHCDYNKPLDVNWLCVPCHNDWHKNNKPIV